MDQTHISEAELDKIWFSGAAITEEETAARQDILMHCQECSTCNELLKNYLGVEREIELLRQGNGEEDHSHCPEEELWLKLMADVLKKKQVPLLLKHASKCHRCAQRLSAAQMYAAENGEDMPERLSAAPEWQANMARQIVLASQPARKKHGEWPRWFSWRIWGPVAAACAIVLAVIWLQNAREPQSIEKLLGQAYSENRTLELRIPYGRYGRVQTERGPDALSHTSKPPALLRAEESVSQHLRTGSRDPVWLDLKGRADLLDGNYSAALKSLQDALQMQPDSVVILTDAATAYFVIAEIEDQPQGYGKAVELVSQALAKSPDDPVALYNRAILHEKMFLYHQAAEDWQHYLRIDSKGQWAEEATQRLNALRKKISEHERSDDHPLLAPSNFIDTVNHHEQAQLQPLIEERSEQYLDRAILEWLPIAFPSPNDSPEKPLRPSLRSVGPLHFDGRGSGARSTSYVAVLALRTLSTVLEAGHQDKWLSDLMNVSPSASFAAAVRALQQAVHANASGDFSTGRNKSQEAARFFHQAKSTAGEIRARYEAIYALERSFQEKDRCLRAAQPLEDVLRRYNYSWIQVQLYLEQSNCWSQMGNFGAARRSVEAALAAGEKSRYPSLYLRALGMAAALYSREGNFPKAYELDRSGLKRYWEGAFPPIRAYQFYSDLGILAEDSAEWHFALALAQEAVIAAAAAHQHVAQAFAHHRLAKIALMTNDGALAAKEFDQASRLFAFLPQTKETWAYQADAEIELAKLQATRGETKQAWTHLATAGTHISQISHYSIALSYYETLAQLNQIDKNNDAGIKALHSALAVAERGLNSLQDDDERLLWSQETNKVYRDLAAWEWKAHNEQEALQIWELYRGAAVRNMHSSGRAKPQREGTPYASSAFAGRTTLSYLQVSDGLIVWVIDESGIAGKWIGISQAEMDRLANGFREECADRYSNLALLRQHGRVLYDLLISPIAKHLSSERTLVIEPDGSMAGIPMAALVDPDGRYLGERYTVVLSAGLLYEQHLRKARRLSPRERALIIGSPAQAYPAAMLGPLADAAEEANYVATKIKVATLLIGSQATLERVQRELTQSTLFHFAGHKMTVHGKGGLLLAPSLRTDATALPLLDAAGLSSVRLEKLQLAVLSACSTAGEDNNYLENPTDLVRLFLQAGVPHVVASYWNIDSGSTIDFMKMFYDQALTGKSIANSLQTAANELRRRPTTSHPYYWAAFAAFGR